MPEEPTVPAAVEPVIPTDPPEPPQVPADPWADPETARKEIEKLRREAAGYRTKAKELEPLAKKAKELEDASKTEAQRLTEQLTAEQARAAKAIRTAVAAKVEALAAGTFADPSDPLGELNLGDYVDDAGAIDADRIKADLAAVLDRKPHWARTDGGPRRPAPDRTQGSSGNKNRAPNSPADEFAGFITRALHGH